MQASEGVQAEDPGGDQTDSKGQHLGAPRGLVMYIELFIPKQETEASL
jgi:hypothetical protein